MRIKREHFLRNNPLINATRPHWWLVKIGSSNDQQAITWANVDQFCSRHMASKLTHWGWGKMAPISDILKFILFNDNFLTKRYALLSVRGYLAKRPLSAMNKHGG